MEQVVDSAAMEQQLPVIMAMHIPHQDPPTHLRDPQRVEVEAASGTMLVVHHFARRQSLDLVEAVAVAVAVQPAVHPVLDQDLVAAHLLLAVATCAHRLLHRPDLHPDHATVIPPLPPPPPHPPRSTVVAMILTIFMRRSIN